MLYLALVPPLMLGGFFDLKSGTIPNILTFGLIIAGLAINYFTGNFITSLIGFVVSFFVLFLLYVIKGGIGGGDVKLIAAIGAWIGLYPLAIVLLASSLIGMLWFAFRSIKKRTFYKKMMLYFYDFYLFKANKSMSVFNFEKENTVPFGTCIAIGYIVSLILTGGDLTLILL